MARILIRGERQLSGQVAISGAKNAALPILAASILAGEGENCLAPIPWLNDVIVMLDLLQSLGLEIETDGVGTVYVRAANLIGWEAPYELVNRMRASVLIMGPLLARLGRARISLPGGCAIGSRPIDLHLRGFHALGAEVQANHGYVEVQAQKLQGAYIYLDYPSVGATENIMMAATLAEGTTIIENAAEEPEIVSLATFLNNMGARVTGAGTNIIRIEGVKELHGANHTIIPDRIEAGTYMVAAAATGGDVLVDNVIIDHVKPVIAKLEEAGVTVYEENGGVRVRASEPIRAVDIKTLPYPGFPTDMQAQTMALMTVAQGTSVVVETVFENRFMHADELKRMGAQVVIEGHTAVVKGVKKLSGAPVKATDLRAGAALVIAGLMAEGTTEIDHVHHIHRGYENLVEKLRGLGADIKEA